MKNEQASARTADAVQFMQLRVAAKDVVQLVEYMLQHGEWYLAEERIERLRNALEGSVCPACGSDRNERDELDKAEREIERLRAEVDALRENNHGWLRANGPGGWIDALRADAERYRWLRDGSNPPWGMQMLERYADNGSDFDAEVDAVRAPQQAEPVAKIIRNDSGQVRMVDGSGEPFDMFAHVGQSYYAHPPAAEVQRLRDALKSLIEVADQSADSQYGTPFARSVRDIARRALEA